MNAAGSPVGGLLAPFRALDLTDEKGLLCGKILADLGADVIKVERPGGDPARRIAPYYKDIPDPEGSLYWSAYNVNKRGITLNIEAPDGKDLFLRLAKSADFILESFAVGYLDGMGLGYTGLSAVNRRVIVTSISPFGQTGPYARYLGSDLVATAMSGFLYLTGDPDRPPLRISSPQAYLHASGRAAAASLVAHHYRERTGRGQHVDVSIRESLIAANVNAISHWDFNRVLLRRAGQLRVGSSGATPRQVWRCGDGLVTFSISGGPAGARVNRALIEWMDSEGMADDFARQIEWPLVDMATIAPDFLARIQERVQAFFISHTKAKLYHGGFQRGIYIYPVSTVRDIADDPQHSARDAWLTIEHPALGASLKYPGAFVKASVGPCQVRRPPPQVGEHDEEVYVRELGLSRREFATLRDAGTI